MRKKKTALQRSEFGQINWVNVFNACYHGLNSAFGSLVTLLIIQNGVLTKTNLIVTGSAFLTTVLGSIFKGLQTNSKGIPFRKEDVK